MPSIPYSIPDLAPAAPEILLLVCACVILLIDVFVSDRSRWVGYALSLVTLGAVAVLVVTGGA